MKKTIFEDMVDRAFWGLEAKYGFKKTDTTYNGRTCSIQFENATTAVLLNYELGNKPWIIFWDIHDASIKSTLGWLLVELGKDEAPTPAQAFQKSTFKGEELDPVLKKMGREIIDNGADFLKGNFALMPKLQARAMKYDQECQRYLTMHKK